ncbi:hypothetical protein B0H15DRAFT_806766 [Mycena belliarum]|uniref:Transmembrane protein n=1 Tax=Mycena belliarum TaxID=1033014 RepID=A0AAD6TT19_9AGAR|nr:hypothetical protein B0H15DRAFT_806766 [Mycena belliae]
MNSAVDIGDRRPGIFHQLMIKIDCIWLPRGPRPSVMTTILETASSPTSSPALVQALPYATYGASFVVSSALTLIRVVYVALAFVAKAVAHPLILLSPFPLLLYVLAPVIVFVQISLDVVWFTPYHAILYLSDAFYPAYVFVGVACITGGLLGISGRLTVLGLNSLLAPPPGQTPKYPPRKRMA